MACSEEGGGSLTRLELELFDDGTHLVMADLGQDASGSGVDAEQLSKALDEARYGDAVRAVLGVQASGESIEATLTQVVRERRQGAVSPEAWLALARALTAGADAATLREEWRMKMPVGERPAGYIPEQWTSGDPGELFMLPREMMEKGIELLSVEPSNAALLAKGALLLEAETSIYLPPLYLNAAVAPPGRAALLKHLAGFEDWQMESLQEVTRRVQQNAEPTEGPLLALLQDIAGDPDRGLSETEIDRIVNLSVNTVNRSQGDPPRMYFPLHVVAKAVDLISQRNGAAGAAQAAEKIRSGLEPVSNPVVQHWTDQALSSTSR